MSKRKQLEENYSLYNYSFYQFMNSPYKFEKFCCICFRDENNVFFKDIKTEELSKDNNNENKYSYWKNDLFSQIQNEEISSIRKYIFKKQNCKHFYHKSCKNIFENFKCQFCEYGFTIENAYNFCIMDRNDFGKVIAFYTKKRIIYEIKYGKQLLDSVYDSIDKSWTRISSDKREKIKEIHSLELKFKKEKLKKEDCEIPLNDSLSIWEENFNKLLDKKNKNKNRQKYEIEEEDDYIVKTPQRKKKKK